jgi:hypothetical protein
MQAQGRCIWCGHDVGDTGEIDHIVPIALGGTCDERSLGLACRL